MSKVDVKATTPPAISYSTFENCSNDIKIYVPFQCIEDYKSAYFWKDLTLLTETMPNNQIWYTSNDGDVVAPYSASGFGSNLISNVYKDGKGILTFDGDVTTIGNSAFYNTSLKSIKIPDCVTEIKYDAFYNCSLTNITIPNSVTSIGTGAFRNCKSLTNIIISNNITEIPQKMCYSCTSLESITIPSNIKNIGVESFDFCNSLSTVIVKAITPPILNSDIFAYCNNNIRIYVPTESLATYKNNFYWNKWTLLTHNF